MPSNTKNSPTNPLSPGRPILLRVKNTKKNANQGITFARPPILLMSRV